MGAPRISTGVGLGLLLFACRDKQVVQATVDAAPQPAPTARAPAPLPSTDFEVSDAPREYKTYVGELAKGEPVVLGVAKDGVRLEAILQVGGELISLRGELLEDNHFVLQDVNPHGKTAVDGSFSGETVTGELLGEGVLKPVPFTAQVKPVFGMPHRTFDRQFAGAFGASGRIRLGLVKKAGVLTGTYRAPKTRENTKESGKFEGEVTDANGLFRVSEGTKKTPGATFEGVFFTPAALLGYWISPDGTKKTFFNAALVTPPPAPQLFDGGRKLAPRETTEESKFCRVLATVPELTGTGSHSVEAGVNDRFRFAIKRAMSEECPGATEKAPVELEHSYEITAVSEQLVFVRTHAHKSAAGAHGSHKYGCFSLDVRAGTTRDATAGKLRPEPRALLEARVKEELKASYGTLEGTCFRSETVKLDDRTVLCVERKGALTVQFQMGEIGCYALGAPRVTVSGEDARNYVAGAPDLYPFFAHR